MEPRTLTPYILQALARHQVNERRVNLQILVDELKVRRVDVRRTISTLHEQGYLDAVTLRLTMNGFAVGMSLVEKELPPLRRIKLRVAAA